LLRGFAAGDVARQGSSKRCVTAMDIAKFEEIVEAVESSAADSKDAGTLRLLIGRHRESGCMNDKGAIDDLPT
jgi:microcystin degradation protein MlrC